MSAPNTHVVSAGGGDLESGMSHPVRAVISRQAVLPHTAMFLRSVAITSSTVCCHGNPNNGAIT